MAVILPNGLWLTLVVALILGWGLDKWYLVFQRDEELDSHRTKTATQARVIQIQREQIKAMSSNRVPPPTPEMEDENEAIRLEVKLLKKQLLGHE